MNWQTYTLNPMQQRPQDAVGLVVRDDDDRVGTFSAPASEWWQAIGFFLCLALFGLQFYPAIALVVMWLVHRYKHDRYAFMFELMFMLGGFGFMPFSLPFKSSDVALVLSLCAIFMLRRSRLTNRIMWLTLAYFAALILIATTSEETMRTQFLTMRTYFTFIAFLLPLVAFANREFEFHRFIHTVILHMLIMSAFYALDTFVLRGSVLVPTGIGFLDSMGRTLYSSIHELYWYPTRFDYYPRQYPVGIYWMALCIIPLARKQVRLSWKQWVLVIFAFFSARTMTFMAGLFVGFICFRGNMRKSIATGLLVIVGLAGIYAVDSALGSPMRVASTVDQFTSLEAAADNEDLAEFGSGRMAQIIPKWELMGDLHRYWLGLGFLHPQLTTNPKFQIKNEYYVDVSKSEEVATQVEVTQFQTIIDCGFLGLIIQTAVYVGIYFMIRRLRYSEYYLCVLVAISVFGIGGFAGLTQRDGLILLATTLGAVLLANPEGRAVPQGNYYKEGAA